MSLGILATMGSRNSGFTLVELMVTLAVMTILVTVAVPAFIDVIRDNRQIAATNELVTALNYARSEAIKRGVPVSVCRCVDNASATPSCDESGSDWSVGWMVFVNPGAPGVVSTAADVLRVHGPVGGAQQIACLKPDNSACDDQFVLYQPDGMPTGDEMIFDVCDTVRSGEDKRKLSLIPTGHVSLQKLPGACS